MMRTTDKHILNPCPICGCSVRVWAKRFDEEDVEYIIECDNDFCGLTYGILCGYNCDEIKKAWNSVTALSSTINGDCVSRQSVLDLLGDWVYECEYDEVAELVEKLPPVSEQPIEKWIPTSDLTNLPKEYEEVIISIRKDNGYEHVTSANFHIEGANIFFGGYDIKEVVAWKPMPEPYKGGDRK